MKNRINVINSKMVALDRSQKELLLRDSTIIPFDYLVLSVGLQHQVPNKWSQVRGIFALNRRSDAQLICNYVRDISASQCSAVIYGSGLHTFSAIEGFL